MARILVVDDEPDVLLTMRIELERVGHETVLAADGEQALERLAGIDVVVLDVTMPVMDGWSFLGALRHGSSTARVVVISGRGGAADARRAVELGAVEYLPKPFLPAQLVAAVEGALRGRVDGPV